MQWQHADCPSFANFQATTGKENHGMSVDAGAGFVSPAAGDSHLKAGNPLIDHGTVLLGFNDTDSRWAYRETAPDIGASEHAP